MDSAPNDHIFRVDGAEVLKIELRSTFGSSMKFLAQFELRPNKVEVRERSPAGDRSARISPDTLPSGANLFVNFERIIVNSQIQVHGSHHHDATAYFRGRFEDLVEVLNDPRLVSGSGVDDE